uniref:Protein kinase domain-containing protein n=1 Tax=Rhizophagus irregularis (strain DAOM 181602 / DAOM 197198 / MUCL 43194) TaxID=747089 RepID=U9SGH2_RHIID
MYENNFFTTYSAIWMNGPLYWDPWNKKFNRKFDIKVYLIYSHILQSIDKFLNEIKANSVLYGISRNPDTNDYIMILGIESYDPYHIKNFISINWSGNETIDNFIQERLEVNNSYVEWLPFNQFFNYSIINWSVNEIVFEWIPYDQFFDINEVDFFTVYLAKWEDGPLFWDKKIKKYNRKLNEIVLLKYFHNLQNIDKFLDKVKASLTKFKIYGISQNPNTKNYVIAYQDFCCRKCNIKYTDEYYKWCKICSVDYLKNISPKWTNGNIKIDKFIQEMRLKIGGYNDKIFEWIPFNQFINIKEVSKDDLFTLYSVKWKSGSLYWETWNKKCVRRSDKEIVFLKCPHNLQSIDEFLNEVKAYSINFEIFGISQSPYNRKYTIAFQEKKDKEYCIRCNKVYTNIDKKWCKQCSIIYLRKNFTNWTSGNKKVDSFIQEKQIEINYSWNNVFEWIPYNQFTNIKEMNEDNLSATWMDGPLYWETWNKKYIRRSGFEVVLRYLRNIQRIDEFLNKVEKSLIIKNNMIYGISQNPNTNYYIIVIQDINCEKCNKKYTNISYKWCKTCQIKDLLNWTSGNEKIDNFIQEKQIENNDPSDTVFEWIPYNQFNNIKEVNKDKFSTVYSAKWMDGPLFWEIRKKIYIRGSDKELALKYLHNLQNTEEFLNKVKQFLIIKNNMIYGISQDPNTKDYLIVFQDVYCEKCNEKYTNISYKWCKTCQIKDLLNWISGNEKIDNFIQKMQIEINDPLDVIFEWIPYNQFNDIKEVNKDKFSTVYSAKWTDGPLYWGIIWNNKKYIRESDKEVALKCSHNLQNNIDEFLSKVKQLLINKNMKIYGISQNPITREYIIVLQDVDYMRNLTKHWISGNEKIDNLIREMKSKINDSHDIIFDWIPYSQFCNIKEIDKGGFATVYAAIWKDGPSYYDSDKKQENKKVALKCLYNSLNITTEFLNEV